MAHSSTISRLLALALIATVASAGAAESTAAAAAKESAKASSADARKSTQEQINATRDKMIVEHEALAKQLKDASEAQRNEILAKMAEQKKNFEETISALVKQTREDDRRRRQNAAAGKR